MSVENADSLDAIGVDEWSEYVVLTVSDHLDWRDEQSHLIALQEKINTYLRFIESGEIDRAYPNAIGRTRVIDVVLRCPPTEKALAFFDDATAILADSGIQLRSRVYPDLQV